MQCILSITYSRYEKSMLHFLAFLLSGRRKEKYIPHSELSSGLVIATHVYMVSFNLVLCPVLRTYVQKA